MTFHCTYHKIRFIALVYKAVWYASTHFLTSSHKLFLSSVTLQSHCFSFCSLNTPSRPPLSLCTSSSSILNSLTPKFLMTGFFRSFMSLLRGSWEMPSLSTQSLLSYYSVVIVNRALIADSFQIAYLYFVCLCLYRQTETYTHPYTHILKMHKYTPTFKRKLHENSDLVYLILGYNYRHNFWHN